VILKPWVGRLVVRVEKKSGLKSVSDRPPGYSTIWKLRPKRCEVKS